MSSVAIAEQSSLKKDKDPTEIDSLKRASSVKSKSSNNAGDDIVQETFDRLTQGIPKHELRLYISEANDCEEALKKEIALMEKALEQGEKPGVNPALDEMIGSPFTALDRYWTASALVGRLRGTMAPPSLFYDVNKANSKAAAKTSVPSGAKSSPEAQKLLDMMKHSAYTRNEPSANILACWKKIFSNRAAIVFKKPVKDEEAPGYSERIRFPMDLSLVRKMIVTRHITCYQQLHSYIGLIAHNCVKYNGRETDYGVVARDFEAVADEIIRQAVLNADSVTQAYTATLTTPSTAVARNSGSVLAATTSATATSTSKRQPSYMNSAAPIASPPKMVSEDSTNVLKGEIKQP